MLVTLEGNIGAGKTTLLKIIEKMSFIKDHVVAYEPVDDWMNLRVAAHEKSLFELYYEDKKRYGFAFQMYALQSRFQHLVKLVQDNPDKIIITERCHLTDHMIFASMLHQQGVITPHEYVVYKTWYESIESMDSLVLAGIMYLQVSPPTCIERICKRNRLGEDNIDMLYIKSLHTQHELWLNTQKNDYPICIINGDTPKNEWDVEKIADFINDLVKKNMS